MKISQYLFWFILSIFLYQNCTPVEENNDSKEPIGEDFGKASLGEIDIRRSAILKIDNLDVEINLSNGEIIRSEHPHWVGQCLSETKQGQILKYIAKSDVCREVHDYPEDIVCAMEYRFAFIHVFVGEGDTRTSLGEANSSCPEKTIGLCEENNIFELLVRSLDFELDFNNCP